MNYVRRDPTFGAIPGASGVRFSVWAPAASRVVLHLRSAGESDRPDVPRVRPPDSQSIEMIVAPGDRSGIWRADVAEARVGDRYAYSTDGGVPRPDPAARFLPDGVHGWSEVIDSRGFRWNDDAWTGLDPRRAVIYELHVGTFTADGTFRAAAAQLPYLRDLGVTAIEIMPVADFAGRRNWGYDGVALFAPSRAYGRPDDLRALVDAAHQHGLAVILDVVYNHLGPEGAYLFAFSPPFTTARHQTPWGGAVNLDDEGGEVVRAFLTENALHWIDEYHLDGLRLDATHSLFDSRQRHFVGELVEAVHTAADPSPLVYAEDHRNLAALLETPDRGGWNLDGVWADDFHHVIRTMLAGDRHGYYADYAGSASELAATLRGGWLFTGQHSAHEGAPRGTDPSAVPLRKSVVCVQNHDQIGNRALGDRLHHTAAPAAWRAAVTVLLTSPMTPLLFMGQEWGTTAPFQFFTDFAPDLGQKVVEGRRREFQAFPEFATAEGAERVPDPQADATFDASRLRWDELADAGHARVLALHRALLRLRHHHSCFAGSDDCRGDATAIDDDTVVVQRSCGETTPRDSALIVARLRGSGPVTVAGLTAAHETRLDTEDAAFASDPHPARVDRARRVVEFARPGALVFMRRA
jgi:maltooligosyltrehalose trehalohydrolase